MEKEESSPLENLKHKMFMTKSARFNADKRLHLEHKLTHISLALISTYLIALSVAPRFSVELLPDGANYDFWSLIASVAVLAISSLQIGNDKTQEAFFLHENAMKIDRALGKLSAFGKNISLDELKELNDEYSAIKEECEFNHCKIDVFWCEVWNTWLTPWQRIKALLAWCLFAIFHYGSFVAAIIIPIIIPIYLHMTSPNGT